MLGVLPDHQHRPKVSRRVLREFAYLPQYASDLHRGVASRGTKLRLPEYARFSHVHARSYELGRREVP